MSTWTTSLCGPLPEKVTVEHFVQQDRVLAECAVVVSHAGSGTVLGSMGYGLPNVCLPLGADQQLNARRLQVLGLGVSLRADTVRADEVQSAVEDVLTSPSYRQDAAAVRDELRALPDVAEAVQALADLSS